MQHLYTHRRLSERDHPDIYGMADAGMTVRDVVAYARRPENEVVDYLRRWLPQTYEKLIHNEGRENFEACIAHYEQLPQESRDVIMDAYLQKDFSAAPQKRLTQDALRFWRTGQKMRALELYTLAIEQAPKDSILLLNRANLYTELGRVSEALHDYERARAGHPKLPEQLFVMQEGLQTMSPEALEVFIRLRRDAQQTA